MTIRRDELLTALGRLAGTPRTLLYDLTEEQAPVRSNPTTPFVRGSDAWWRFVERRRVLDYLGSNGRQVHWDLIRVASMSVADLAIFPLQDLLGLGSRARMNVPGTVAGNWSWRFDAAALTPAVAEHMGKLTALYGRSPAGASETPFRSQP